MKTLAFVLSLTAPAIVKAAQKPNLVFMILDDQDSMLGSGLDVMPNYVARFKEGGATATNAFVASPKVGGLPCISLPTLHHVCPYNSVYSAARHARASCPAALPTA